MSNITTTGLDSRSSWTLKSRCLSPTFSPAPNCVGVVTSTKGCLKGISNAFVAYLRSALPLATGLQSIFSPAANSVCFFSLLPEFPHPCDIEIPGQISHHDLAGQLVEVVGGRFSLGCGP